MKSKSVFRVIGNKRLEPNAKIELSRKLFHGRKCFRVHFDPFDEFSVEFSKTTSFEFMQIL